jgi:exopolysaccharide biosynthesis polyprenyl glycosylphosphotransferase
MLDRYRRWINIALVMVDIILINAAFALAYYIRYELQWFRAVDPAFNQPFRAYIPFAAVLTVLLIVTFRLEGVYHYQRGGSWFDEFYSIINGTTTGIVIMVVIVFIYQPLAHSRLLFFQAGVLIIALLGFSRLVKRQAMGWLRKRGLGTSRVLIVGAGELGRAVMRNIVAHPEFGYDVVGFVDDDPEKGRTDIGRFKGLGGVEKLPSLISEHKVNEVIVTLPWQYHRKILNIIYQCEREQVRPRIVPDIFQIVLSQMHIDDLGGIPLISIKDASFGGWSKALKRSIDFTFSLVGLVVLAPLLGLIALAIKLDSPGPILFRQVRLGKEGKPFTLSKFRSMCLDAEEKQARLTELNEADGPIFKIRDDPRLTRVGKILRRVSLDELPQLYNVLRGEMSLIGPRPPLPQEVEQYREWHKRRLEVSPGMTGLPQVSGRSDLTFDEMALLDIFYIEEWSLALDAKIFLKTIPSVILGRGAY